jgi:shikimate kinase
MSDHFYPKPDLDQIKHRIGVRCLVLVGLMGSGKSTIGRMLANTLNIPFLDADTEIERVSNRSIVQLFEHYGEREFRELERRVIRRILRNGPLVLATGGGAFMNERTRNMVSKRGISIWINAHLDVLMERVSRKTHRPLLHTANPRQTMQDLMTVRYPIYETADIMVLSHDDRREPLVFEMIAAIEKNLGI